MHQLPNLACKNCLLSKSVLSGKITPIFGETTAKKTDDVSLMLVGIAPGTVENHLKRPFVGPAGAYLRQVLASEKVAVSLSRVLFANVLMCKLPNDRLPFEDEVGCCRWHFGEIFTKYQHIQAIVWMGHEAAKHANRYHFWTKHISYKLTTYHPAAGLYAPFRKAIIEKEWQIIASHLRDAKVI